MGSETYNARDVDWYYNPAHEQADGDGLFWWPDWLKTMSSNSALDAWDAENMYQAQHAVHDLPKTSPDGVVTREFTGSHATDPNDNIFFSAKFDIASGRIMPVKLFVSGVDTPIPIETIQAKQTDGTYVEEDSKHDAYYPVAPI